MPVLKKPKVTDPIQILNELERTINKNAQNAIDATEPTAELQFKNKIVSAYVIAQVALGKLKIADNPKVGQLRTKIETLYKNIDVEIASVKTTKKILEQASKAGLALTQHTQELQDAVHKAHTALVKDTSNRADDFVKGVYANLNLRVAKSDIEVVTSAHEETIQQAKKALQALQPLVGTTNRDSAVNAKIAQLTSATKVADNVFAECGLVHVSLVAAQLEQKARKEAESNKRIGQVQIILKKLDNISSIITTLQSNFQGDSKPISDAAKIQVRHIISLLDSAFAPYKASVKNLTSVYTNFGLDLPQIEEDTFKKSLHTLGRTFKQDYEKVIAEYKPELANEISSLDRYFFDFLKAIGNLLIAIYNVVPTKIFSKKPVTLFQYAESQSAKALNNAEALFQKQAPEQGIDVELDETAPTARI